jgi:hypothetical protein
VADTKASSEEYAMDQTADVSDDEGSSDYEEDEQPMVAAKHRVEPMRFHSLLSHFSTRAYTSKEQFMTGLCHLCLETGSAVRHCTVQTAMCWQDSL